MNAFCRLATLPTLNEDIPDAGTAQSILAGLNSGTEADGCCDDLTISVIAISVFDQFDAVNKELQNGI